jgi:hypothetical protein
LERLALHAPRYNPAAFGAPRLDLAGIVRTAFNTPQKIAGSLLALLGAALVLIRQRRALWFTAGWLIVTLLMNPRLLGLDRAGLLDEIHWKFAVQTAVASFAGLTVGLAFDRWGDRSSNAWNFCMLFVSFILATFGAARAEPVPEFARYVLPEDFRLISWMKEHLPADEKIAARCAFDRELVVGSDASNWIPYFTRHRSLTFAATLEKTPPGSRDKLRSFAHELHRRDMSTPESAIWMREQGYPWFYIGATERQFDATLSEQIARNPLIELVRAESGARLYHVR